MFLHWLIDDNGGPKVVATFEKNGQVLFSPVGKDERLS